MQALCLWLGLKFLDYKENIVKVKSSRLEILVTQFIICDAKTVFKMEPAFVLSHLFGNVGNQTDWKNLDTKPGSEFYLGFDNHRT